MTLVVGRISDGKICLISDTATNSELKLSSCPYTEGCLKTYVINNRVAIAFANSVDAFKSKCAELLSINNPLEIVQFALNEQRTEWPVELMVAEIGTKYLWIVKNGKCIESSSGFLGDIEAYSEYQKYFLPSIQINHASNLSKINKNLEVENNRNSFEFMMSMDAAFSKVIHDPKFPNVAGGLLRLRNVDQKFQFAESLYLVGPPIDMNKLKVGSNIHFGNAQNGGFSIQIISGEDRVNPYMLFQFGNFKVLFPPDENGFRGALLVGS
jgi:hypothetical protein